MPRTSYWICYDITDPKRLQRVARIVEAVGQRVHYSAYLCELDTADLAALQRQIARLIDVQTDSVRYLPLCRHDRAATLHLGDSAFAASASSSWVV